MAQTNLYQQYKAQALGTLTKGEIVVKLFEEASKQISTAIFLIKRQDFVTSFNCISKARKIISTLDHSLDTNFAISIELHDMYMFLFHQLGEASVKKDVDLLKDLLALVDDLKNTFKQADKLTRAGQASI